MKRKILCWAFLLAMSISNSMANTGEGIINSRILQSFKQQFAGVQDVQWSTTSKGLVKAAFSLNDQFITAYYAKEGDLLGITRNIVPGQLPIHLFTAIKQRYSGYWITDLFEMAAHNETSYYITLQCSDHTLVLSSNDAATWHVYRKEKI